jgi:hypothetical protein
MERFMEEASMPFALKRPKKLLVVIGVAAIALLGGLSVLLIRGTAGADQTFDSRSTGADGALDLSDVPEGTTVVFNPDEYLRPDGAHLDPERDNVYHFTTILIPANVTVRLASRVLGSNPVYWLATGAVVIRRHPGPER